MNRRVPLFMSLMVLTGIVMAALLPMLLSPIQENASQISGQISSSTPTTINSIAPARDADERNLPVWINYFNTCCDSATDPLHFTKFGKWSYPLGVARPHEYTGAQFELPFFTRISNKKDLTIFQFAQPDSYVMGGPPVGGLTYGWGLPETYAGNATRQIILSKVDHTSGVFLNCDRPYATDISVENAPLDFIPVYSTLIGTVVEVMGSNPQGTANCPVGVDNCHGYGNFVRTRNSSWSSVNAVTLYNDKNECPVASRFETSYPDQETPAHAADKLSCMNANTITDDECKMDCIVADSRTSPTECTRPWVDPILDDPLTLLVDESAPGYYIDCDPCRGSTQYGSGPWQGCGNKAPDLCFSYYCIKETTNIAIPGAGPYRVVVNNLPPAMFRNKRLGEPPYGYYRDVGDTGPLDKTGVGKYVDIALVHVTNWEVVQAFMTDGSVDRFVPSRDITLDNYSQIGTLGNSGYYESGGTYFLNSKRPMLHYEIWRNGGGAWDPPDTYVQPFPYNPADYPQVPIGNADAPVVPTIYNQFTYPNVCKDDQLTADVLANIDNGKVGTAHCVRTKPDGSIMINDFDVYTYSSAAAAWSSPGGQPLIYQYKSYTYPEFTRSMYWKIDHTVGEDLALLSITVGGAGNYASHRQYLPDKITGPFQNTAGPIEVDQVPVYFNFDVGYDAGTQCFVMTTDLNNGPDTYTAAGIETEPLKCMGKARVDEHPDQHRLTSGYESCSCNAYNGQVCASSDPTVPCVPVSCP